MKEFAAEVRVETRDAATAAVGATKRSQYFPGVSDAPSLRAQMLRNRAADL